MTVIAEKICKQCQATVSVDDLARRDRNSLKEICKKCDNKNRQARRTKGTESKPNEGFTVRTTWVESESNWEEMLLGLMIQTSAICHPALEKDRKIDDVLGRSKKALGK